MAYRKASHRSTRCEQSRKRQERSKERFIELAEAKDPNLKEAIVHLDLQIAIYIYIYEILYMNKYCIGGNFDRLVRWTLIVGFCLKTAIYTLCKAAICTFGT